MKKIQSLADGKSMDVCVIKDNSEHLKQLDYNMEREGIKFGGRITRAEVEMQLERIAVMFSSRLKDESFRAIIDFHEAMIVQTPIEEIQKALVS